MSVPKQHVASQADVRLQSQRGTSLLPCQCSIEDALVLGMHIPIEPRRGTDTYGYMPIALAMAVQDIQQMPCPR